MAEMLPSTPDIPPCPYQHAADMPTPGPTTPKMVVIALSETTEQALFARIDPSAREVTALADSGASHVLFQASAAHVLQQVEYSLPHDPPFAVLKAANHGVLKAIGRGLLSVSDLNIMAFIFHEKDLANNLLGLIPFANAGCTMVFKPTSFHIFRGTGRTAILSGKRADEKALWRVPIHNELETPSDGIPPPTQHTGLYVEANAVTVKDNATYVRYVHASLGYPSPSTFLRAVTSGFITGPDQFPRLTSRMVRKHLPNALATAKGHLDRTRANPPHAASDAVSARKRHQALLLCHHHRHAGKSEDSDHSFEAASDPDHRSETLHMDYTGPLPDACSSGTRYFQISCHGGYINIQPLLNLRHEHTTVALRQTVEFFREHGAVIKKIRMDNQQSGPLLQMVKQLDVTWELVPSFSKSPNRSERAIRTAKNHMISTRAGFHPDCPPMYWDKCLAQIEMTLNIVRPYEYDDNMSAYEGLHGTRFNFRHHPIAPVGTKVLTWDAPDHRGSWADHGVPAVYLGPALDHFRSFEVWVPSTSAPRITNTVWWFMHDVSPGAELLEADQTHAYPPTKDRPDPQPNGSDLIGRTFLEPEIGVCQITGLGPVTQHHMPTRAQTRKDVDPPLTIGSHYTLTYTQTNSGEEHYSSLSEILNWIQSGPLLQPPAVQNDTEAPITTPAHAPATIQYVPWSGKQRVPSVIEVRQKQRVPVPEEALQEDQCAPKQRVVPSQSSESAVDPSHPPTQRRMSERIRLQARAYLASQHDDIAGITCPSFVAPIAPLGFENLTLEEDWERFRELVEGLEQRDHTSPDEGQRRNITTIKLPRCGLSP